MVCRRLRDLPKRIEHGTCHIVIHIGGGAAVGGNSRFCDRDVRNGRVRGRWSEPARRCRFRRADSILNIFRLALAEYRDFCKRWLPQLEGDLGWFLGQSVSLHIDLYAYGATPYRAAGYDTLMLRSSAPADAVKVHPPIDNIDESVTRRIFARIPPDDWHTRIVGSLPMGPRPLHRLLSPSDATIEKRIQSPASKATPIRRLVLDWLETALQRDNVAQALGRAVESS